MRRTSPLVVSVYVALAGCATVSPPASHSPVEPVRAEPQAPTPPTNTAAVAERFFARLAADDFDGAAGLFHYRDTGPTEEQRQAQRREISHFLAQVTAAMGRITTWRPAGKVGEVLFGSIGSGTVAYWQAAGEPVSLSFAAEFEREGTGYVQLVFASVDGAVALRSVGVGLAASRPGAAERLRVIMDQAFTAPDR